VLDLTETAALEAKKAAAQIARLSAVMREGSDIPLPHPRKADAVYLWRNSVPRIFKEEAMRAPIAFSLALSLGTPAMT
jgi:hypothetical protein